MLFIDYYKILGLETNKVNIEQIKNAFREQAKKYHPDVNKGTISEERFKDINEAYRILSNRSSRRKYDRIWYSHVGKKIDREKQNIEREEKTDIFTLLFGNIKFGKNKQNKKIAIKGENIETEVNISLEQAFFGTSKKISLRAVDGKMKTFSVKIPAGILNKEKIRLIGQGKPGINGGKNGDLFININIENNKKFKLQGYDIYTELAITPWEAVLGTKAQVDSIDESSNIYIPQGMESGETLKIKQKGYKDGKGGRGDLIVQIKIVVPKNPSEKEIKLYKKLKEVVESEPKTINA